MRKLLIVLASSLALLAAAPGASAAPPIKHVFTIVLENKGYNTTFGPSSPAPYLSKTLPSQGALLTQYYGIGHASLVNYIAMIGGQAPTPDTQSDCEFYTDVMPGTPTSDGQFIGQGCVYPAAAKTVADQLEAGGRTWKGYMEDMGNAPGESQTCAHPAPNTFDQTENARPGDGYAAKHDPFVYFHSLLDSGSCDRNVVALSKLTTDLSTAATTPNYVFITPNLCNDAHDCGLAVADQFLKTWIPRIKASPAWAEGSMLIVTFDEAESNDASACCNEQPGPNSPNPGGTTPGPGGGRTGAVLVSPFSHPGTVSNVPYNHYSLLKSVEDVFGLPYLGYAGQAGLQAFGTDVYR
ncbi:MAG: alkaline phosphatase family protein [Gaiellaceae bacterium]